MSLGLIMKLFHVLAAFGLIAGAVGRNITFGQAAKTANLRSIFDLLQLSQSFERWLFFPAYGAVFLFGLVTGWLQGWPILGFLQDATANWLLVSLLVWLGLGL